MTATLLEGARARLAAWTEPLGWFPRERFPALPSDAQVLREMESGCIELPAAANPSVSVVVPVYGKFATTWNCLKSLSTTEAGVSFEVILVDDRSPDRTADMLKRVNNLRVLSNPENLGYLRSNNRASELARGEWICLLNNDTWLTPNWLRELVATFRSFDRVGLVGSKLLFADGRLQEAGGNVLNDASCENYGRFADPERPEYNFARHVDYCSAACVLLPHRLWQTLGGFDEWFAPAYYEDTDLAFRVRRAGYEVTYQPLSRVVHYHGVTHGKSAKHGLKRSLLTNKARFLERWRDELSAHPQPGSNPRESAERRSREGLLLAGPATPGHMALALAVRHTGHRVSMWSPKPLDAELRLELNRRGVEVLQPPHVNNLSAALRWARYRIAIKPGEALPGLAECLRSLRASG